MLRPHDDKEITTIYLMTVCSNWRQSIWKEISSLLRACFFRPERKKNCYNLKRKEKANVRHFLTITLLQQGVKPDLLRY